MHVYLVSYSFDGVSKWVYALAPSREKATSYILDAYTGNNVIIEDVHEMVKDDSPAIEA